MNGRVYDPIVGRFLSVDPLVGNPLSAQDYNGYSYCANNPMKYTDPSGYTYWKPVGNGEWEHFEYHPFQNGSANFREASNGGVAYYGAPMTYRYAAGQYRDEKGNVVSYEAVHKNYIAPNSAKVESYSALLDYLSAGFSFRYETAGNYWGYVAVDGEKSIGVLAFFKAIKGPKATGGNGLATASFLASAASFGYDSWNNLVYDGDHYIPTKGPNAGKPTSVWKMNPSGNFATRNGNKIPNSLNAASKIGVTNLVEVGGVALNIAGLGFTSYDIYQNGLNVSNGADFVMGGVAFIPGVGWIASGAYFGGKTFVDCTITNTNCLMNNGINPGNPIFFK